MRTILDEITRPSTPSSGARPSSRGSTVTTSRLPAKASLKALEIFTTQFAASKLGSRMSQIAIIFEAWIRFAEHYKRPIQFEAWNNCEERVTVLARKDYSSINLFINAVVRNSGSEMLIRNTIGLYGGEIPNSGDVLIWKYKNKTTGECLRKKTVRLVHSLFPIVQGDPRHNEKFNIVERGKKGTLELIRTPTAFDLRKAKDVKIGGKTYEKTIAPSNRTARRFKGFRDLK